jgi:hypothetical protein
LTTWREVKDARILLVGKKCEVCGKRLDRKDAKGHHILPRKLLREYRLFLVELCQLRCDSCEKEMHRIYPLGNPPELMERLRKIRGA